MCKLQDKLVKHVVFSVILTLNFMYLHLDQNLCYEEYT